MLWQLEVCRHWLRRDEGLSLVCCALWRRRQLPSSPFASRSSQEFLRGVRCVFPLTLARSLALALARVQVGTPGLADRLVRLESRLKATGISGAAMPRFDSDKEVDAPNPDATTSLFGAAAASLGQECGLLALLSTCACVAHLPVLRAALLGFGV
eukprot:2510844-Rhodomonas_salina.1